MEIHSRKCKDEHVLGMWSAFALLEANQIREVNLAGVVSRS